MILREVVGDDDADHEPGCLGDHGGDGRAGDAEVQRQHQQQGRHHVEDIDRDLYGKRQRGAGLSDQPAQHDKISEHKRRRPYPDRNIGSCRPGNPLAAAHGAEQNRGQRDLQCDQPRAHQASYDQSAHQDRAHFVPLA